MWSSGVEETEEGPTGNVVIPVSRLVTDNL